MTLTERIAEIKRLEAHDPRYVILARSILPDLIAAYERQREALEQIKTHHITLNSQVGRPIGHSRTIALCESALAAEKEME